MIGQVFKRYTQFGLYPLSGVCHLSAYAQSEGFLEIIIPFVVVAAIMLKIVIWGLIAEEGTVEEIFRNPKTKIGQELVLHEGANREAYTGRLPYCYRLVFKGGSENEPVLGQMMIDTKGLVNILAANTRTIDDEAFGQMVLQFPEEKELRETMIQYLKDRGVVVEEVEYV